MYVCRKKFGYITSNHLSLWRRYIPLTSLVRWSNVWGRGLDCRIWSVLRSGTSGSKVIQGVLSPRSHRVCLSPWSSRRHQGPRSRWVDYWVRRPVGLTTIIVVWMKTWSENLGSTRWVLKTYPIDHSRKGRLRGYISDHLYR